MIMSQNADSRGEEVAGQALAHLHLEAKQQRAEGVTAAVGTNERVRNTKYYTWYRVYMYKQVAGTPMWA